MEWSRGGMEWSRGMDCSRRGMEWWWRGMEWVEWQGTGVRGHPKCWVVWYVGRGEEGRMLAGVERGERGQAGRVVKHRAWGRLPQGGEEARVEGYGRSRWMMRSRCCWMVAVRKTWEANVARAARR